MMFFESAVFGAALIVAIPFMRLRLKALCKIQERALERIRREGCFCGPYMNEFPKRVRERLQAAER